MYDMFTDRSRKVMALANEEALRLNHDYVGTEHVLVGLIREGSGVAANILKALRLDLHKIRTRVEEFVQHGHVDVAVKELPYTPRAKNVVEYSMDEARKLDHHYVGTEHLLLGLVREKEGVAARVLVSLDVTLEEIRTEVLKLLGHGIDESSDVQSIARGASLSPVAAVFAVDIGNSRIKVGRFSTSDANEDRLPTPDATFDLSIRHETGEFDVRQLAAWCGRHVANGAHWRVASVHRGAADRLIEAIRQWSNESSIRCSIRQLTYRDAPLEIRVGEPTRVGIDRLLAAFAADQLRHPDRAAVIVDLGTAITVDLLETDGAFAGGAILPGITMAARALDEQTDALPRIGLDHLDAPPTALGKSTAAAIEAGLYWGTIGAIRELIAQLSAGQSAPPDIFVTGGASPHVAKLLAEGECVTVKHVPHLVLAGIALVAER